MDIICTDSALILAHDALVILTPSEHARAIENVVFDHGLVHTYAHMIMRTVVATVATICVVRMAVSEYSL